LHLYLFIIIQLTLALHPCISVDILFVLIFYF